MTDAERIAVKQWRERVAPKIGRARRMRQGERVIALECAAAEWGLIGAGHVIDHDPGDEDRS